MTILRRKVVEMREFEAILDQARKSGELSWENYRRLLAMLGEVFRKAWEAVKEGRVKKYVFKPSERVVWVVVGRHRDYTVLPSADFCTCDDFFFRVMKGEKRLCYHIVAQKLAEALGRFEVFEESDEMYSVLMREWMQPGG